MTGDSSSPASLPALLMASFGCRRASVKFSILCPHARAKRVKSPRTKMRISSALKLNASPFAENKHMTGVGGVQEESKPQWVGRRNVWFFSACPTVVASAPGSRRKDNPTHPTTR